MLGQVKLGQVRLGQFSLDQVLKKDSVPWNQLGQVRLGQDSLGYVGLGSQEGLCSMELVGLIPRK